MLRDRVPSRRRRIGLLCARLLLSALAILLIASLIEFTVTTLDVAARERPLMEIFTSRDDAEIRDGMEGALCRCMTYYRIQQAIKRVVRGPGAAGSAA